MKNRGKIMGVCLHNYSYLFYGLWGGGGVRVDVNEELKFL